MSKWKHGLLPDFFCNTVRKALSVLAKRLIGENHLLMDGRKIQNFRPYEKHLTKATTKTEPEFQSHTVMWSMDRNRSWKAEWSVQTNFGDIEIFSLSIKSFNHLQKNGALYTKMVSSISDKSTYHTWPKHNGISSLTEESIYTCVLNDIDWKLKNCTEKSFCVIFPP